MELYGQNVTLLMGATGSGKSTLANGIISGADALEEDDDDHIVTTKPLYQGSKPVFVIGHEAKGQT